MQNGKIKKKKKREQQPDDITDALGLTEYKENLPLNCWLFEATFFLS